MEIGNEYDHIELTQQEIDKALYLLKREKHFKQKNIEYANEVKREPTYLKFTSEKFVDYLKWKDQTLGLKFRRNEFNRELFKDLCDYFTETEGGKIDQTKGLLFFGNVGRGKTTLVKLFNENQKSSYRVVACKVIADEFLKPYADPDYIMSKYSRRNSELSFHTQFGNGKEFGICFDDLGTEDEIKNYGNQRNVMADLILRCYDNHLLKGKVHITTNLTKPQIKEIYGDRVASRLQEMCNEIIIPLETPDYRTIKNETTN